MSEFEESGLSGGTSKPKFAIWHYTIAARRALSVRFSLRPEQVLKARRFELYQKDRKSSPEDLSDRAKAASPNGSARFYSLLEHFESNSSILEHMRCRVCFRFVCVWYQPEPKRKHFYVDTRAPKRRSEKRDPATSNKFMARANAALVMNWEKKRTEAGN